jgi:hypothetical protein
MMELAYEAEDSDKTAGQVVMRFFPRSRAVSWSTVR